LQAKSTYFYQAANQNNKSFTKNRTIFNINTRTLSKNSVTFINFSRQTFIQNAIFTKKSNNFSIFATESIATLKKISYIF